MKLLDLRKSQRRPDRPVTWKYWPVSVGWFRKGGHALICWHGWPATGSGCYPDATAKVCGWTLHLGAIKVKFGR